MFEDIPVEALNEIAGRVRLRGLGDGQPVFRQGDQPDAFYVVRKGVLEVVEEDTRAAANAGCATSAAASPSASSGW